jgi:putative DNA primase/helicase
LAYAKAGLFVFPLAQRSKTPITSHGFKDACRDPEEISGWWRRHPEANVGIATGFISHVVVIDVDRRNGGDESLDALPALPRTVESSTGGGGRHFYLSHPGGSVRLPSRNGVLGRGLDVKADGGYVVAPPSIHENGRRYAWVHSPTDTNIAPCPEWLLVKLGGGNSKGKRTRGDYANGEPIPEGSRETVLTSLAGTMRRARMTREEIEAALLCVNERRCRPPLSESAVRRIAKSIGSKPPGVSTASTDQPRLRVVGADEIAEDGLSGARVPP